MHLLFPAYFGSSGCLYVVAMKWKNGNSETGKAEEPTHGPNVLSIFNHEASMLSMYLTMPADIVLS